MPINFGELYTALQQGVVDGQENPFAIIYSNSFFEVQKYLSVTGHIWGGALLSVNSSAWNRSRKIQETVICRQVAGTSSAARRGQEDDSSACSREKDGSEYHG
ncbi:hypothetical protein MASR2M17_17130 [Aminivibrio sp.]